MRERESESGYHVLNRTERDIQIARHTHTHTYIHTQRERCERDSETQRERLLEILPETEQAWAWHGDG